MARTPQFRPRWVPIGLQVLGLEIFTLLGTTIGARFHPHSRTLDLLAYVLVVAAGGAIALSRRWPIGAVGLSLAAVLAYHSRDYPPGPIDVALMVALFKGAAPQYLWRSLALGAVTVLGYLAVSVLVFEGVSLEAMLLGTFAVAASLGLGHAVAAQRAYARQKREEETQRRVTEERLRIARELHDVVSHSISMINVRAGVAAHVMAERPEQAREALLAIKATSKDTLRELRGILHVLRQVDEAEPRGPAPGLDQLEILVDTARQAGVPTRASVVGTVRPLPPAVDLAAYRIIQESLTNVVRHAGRASAEVTVVYEPNRVVVEVSDDGRGAANPTEKGRTLQGHGIVGMRERVTAVGGEVEAGPRNGRGFHVRAWLPTDGAES
jgi:signal transduction histidine kinase